MSFKTKYDALRVYSKLKGGKQEIRGVKADREQNTMLVESSIAKSNDGGVYLRVEGIADIKKLNACLVENAEEEEEKESKEDKEQNNDDGEKKKRNFKPLLLIPVVMVIGLASCTHTDEKIVQITENKQVILYNTENPGMIKESLAQTAGQEEMTNGGYNWKEQAERETNATTDYKTGVLLEQQVDECYNILQDDQKTQEEKFDAIKKMNSVYAQQQELYENGREDVTKLAEDAKDALTSKPDERTESEVRIVDNQTSKYDKSQGLTEANVQSTEQVVGSPNDIRDIKAEREPDGDIKITYNEVKELVEKQSHRGIVAAVHNISDYVKNVINKVKNAVTRTERKDSQETNERSQQENNRDGEGRDI